jgi:hypothetical protein
MEETPKTKTTIQVITDFIKQHPKKIATILIALLSLLPPESREITQSILEAMLQAN